MLFVSVPAQARTVDPLIKSQLLYQLSYGDIICAWRHPVKLAVMHKTSNDDPSDGEPLVHPVRNGNKYINRFAPYIKKPLSGLFVGVDGFEPPTLCL